MGRLGDLTTGTELERQVYRRALGMVLILGDRVRDVRPVNETTWLGRALAWVGWA
jgi:hypothetical protein